MPRFPRPRPPNDPVSLAEGGGATTEVPPGVKPVRACDPITPLPNCTGGGTTLLVPPNPTTVWRSREAFPSCTGGATTWRCISPAPNPGPCAAKSRVTCGGGATTPWDGNVSRGFKLVIRSGADTGGGTTCACIPGRWMAGRSRWGALGGGAMTPASRVGVACILSRSTSGAGGTTAVCKDADDCRNACSPSAGGGPGTGL